MPGTSAKLISEDSLYLDDLFYALMLPSGNDAAYALAHHFGKLLLTVPKLESRVKLSYEGSHYKSYPEVLRFIEEMNSTAVEMKLKHTFYDSPHGLSNVHNYSTAYDQCVLVSK
jgi:serine-type D-Ala-D-Ala carboxypeptidase (penicillin-binding protein 5/6)